MTEASRRIGVVLNLALPLVVAQLAVILSGVSDTLLASRHAARTAAEVGIASSIFVTAAVTLIGLMHGLSPILAELWSRGEHQRMASTLKTGVVTGLGVTLAIVVIVTLELPRLMRLFDVPIELRSAVQQYLQIALLALPAVVIARSYYVLASATDRARTIIAINFAALGVKVAVTWLLISGAFGMPSLGSSAFAISTVAMFWVSVICSFLALYAKPYDSIRRSLFDGRLSWNHSREMLSQGVPIAFSQVAEVTSLTVVSLIVAPLGSVSVAAHQILSSLTVLSFTFPYCFGMATQVMISRSLGGRDVPAARQFARTGLKMTLCIAVALVAIVFTGREQIIATFTREPTLAAAVDRILPVFCVYVVFDALLAGINSSLRGFRIVTLPAIVTMSSLWVVGVGGGWALCYRKVSLDAGAVFGAWRDTSGLFGIWLASATALVLGTTLVALRLTHAHRRPAGFM